jgi:T5SS/PEP-CTERM-associated repeat protein
MYLLLDVDGTGIMGAGYRRYGTLSISDGQAVVSREGIIAYGAAAGGMASVTGRGSLWATTGEMYVGYQGNGAITISNQGAVSSRGTSIGFMPGATGVARVNGATWTNSSTMYVGRDGWGELTIENNSYVQTMSALLGVGIGSHGRATVASRDSRWEIQSSLNVGVGGGGELNVGFGGRVSSANVAIGVFSEATGSVTVNRGQLIAAEELVVGYGGEGALSVSEAGSVASGMALIGRDLGSFGTASLIGHGSEWNVDGQLNVGRQGTGHLSISNNALVTSSSGVVGQQVGSVGTVDVAGGTWAIDGSLWVGGAFGRGGARGGGSVGGSALVNIGPGGVVGVADDTVLFSNDVMRLDGGTLVTSEVDFRGGRLDWQSGTLHLTSEQGLAIGPGQPFDASVLLGPTQVLQVDHRLYVESRGRMVTESGINVGSAEIEPLGQLLVAGGQRAMFGDGVVNRGDLVFLAGTLVEGPVTNEERGVTTLLDDVVFLAPVDGEGNFHGHGLPSFAGGFLPGDGPANVFFASDIEFRPNNLLRIDVEGNFPIDEYDVLNVRGRANLGGTLEVLADPRVNVEIGDLLTFIHADGGVFGRFSSLELPSLTGGKMFRFMQDGTTVSLEVIATPPLPGDYNEDGIVNAADYIVWRNSQGTDAALPNRDAQLAGNVGMGDYEHWRAHFGHRVRGTSRATAVPEPTSWLLISLGILLVGGQRRRR